jgi:hypothetical protein
MRKIAWLVLSAAYVTGASQAAHADLTISQGKTRHMTCSGGVCSPNAADAVLNTTDLANMLASGDVEVTDNLQESIVVKTSFGWASTSRLTLNPAPGAVVIEKPVMVTGTGAVTVTTGNLDALTFEDKGAITFWDTASNLTVNGNSYTLVGDIGTLASDIAANPSGFYALANDYDASVDGVYTSIPVQTDFPGTFNGLGHVISNLTIQTSNGVAGLFLDAGQGTLRDIGLTNVSISSGSNSGDVGTLLAVGDFVTIVNCYASGKLVSGDNTDAGGLVGVTVQSGTIIGSHAAVDVSSGNGSLVGGLVGDSNFEIFRSYASGKVTGGANAQVGGLIGSAGGLVELSFATGGVRGGANSTVGGLFGNAGAGSNSNNYATGAVKGGEGSIVGGLVGENGESTSQDTSYAIGHVGGKTAAKIGGLIGQLDSNENENTLFYDYWDTTTTGQPGHHGCGGQKCPGQSKGLTTEELQAGLPAEFTSNIWGENPDINGGLPYLLANPPK